MATVIKDMDELIAKYIEASGIGAAEGRIKNRVQKATFSVPAMGMEGESITYTEPPNMYSKTTLGALGDSLRGVSGGVVWAVNQIQGASISEGDAAAAQKESVEFNRFKNWKENFESVDVVGEEEVDGTKAFKVVAKRPSGNESTFYFAEESGLLLRVDALGPDGSDTSTLYSDYREVDGVKIPYKVRVEGGQVAYEITTSHVEHNIDIHDGTFDLPDEIKALRGEKTSEAHPTVAPAEKIYVTLQPFDLSDELSARVEELDLVQTVEHVKDNGYGYVHDAAPVDFTERLRETILRVAGENKGVRPNNMLLDKDPIFEEVVLNPKLLTMAEVMVGKGAMMSQLVASVRGKGAPALALHADQNWMPAPFPVHNGLITFCWACDEFTKESGATKVIPKTHVHRRHPNAEEIAEFKGAIATECPAGTVVFWDGSVWHGNWPRTIEGQRVVLHITYSRLALRPVECYDYLDEEWLKDKPFEMRVVLGREDFLNTRGGAFSDIPKLQRTFNWAKT